MIPARLFFGTPEQASTIRLTPPWSVLVMEPPCHIRTAATHPCVSFAIALFFLASCDDALFLWDTDVAVGLGVGGRLGGNQGASQLGLGAGEPELGGSD